MTTETPRHRDQSGGLIRFLGTAGRRGSARGRLRASVPLWLVMMCVLGTSAAKSSAIQRSAASLSQSPMELRIGFARPGGGYAVTTIPLETYVARVLAGEAARDSPPAALEALAVTIRTYA